jgi:nucleotide-binding universal stress UspA family protein
MARYRKILVAFDGSTSAANSLRRAAQLARQDKSWIKVLAVIPSYAGDLSLIGVSRIKETIEGPGRKLLEEAKAIAEAEDVHILSNLEQGEPYEKIVQVADEENCDLIVMGRKGLSRMERQLMGSVTARVIGYTGKDVLVVPHESPLAWSNLLLATDGSKYSEAAVTRAIDLARERNSRVTAVSVVFTNDEYSAMAPKAMEAAAKETRAYLDEVKQKAACEGVVVESVIREGEPPQMIIQAAADSRADLIIMGSHGRKGLTRLLMGSVTERVIGYATCPVLIAH